MNLNICGYTDSNVRLAVILPFEDGWAVAGQHTWPGGKTPRKFATLDAAKADVLARNGATRLHWKEELV